MTPPPNSLMQKLVQSVGMIQSQYKQSIQAGLILGSGLGAFADSLKNAVRIPYEEIPHFARSNVEGHSGTLVLAEIAPGFSIACMQGRFHYYEGHDLNSVVYPVRVMRQLGAQTLIVTNAAGGINADFQAGNLMLITDHLNLLGDNPLRGPNCDELGPRFPDMSQAYCRKLQAIALEKANELEIECRHGIYAACSGPTYETPAEVRMLQTLGADAVGMSTVPEVIAANHMGMQVLGLSCITNLASGISPHKLSHQEVMETGERVRSQFIALLEAVLGELAHTSSTSPLR